MGDQEKARGAWTWERTIEIMKIAATVYVGLVGTVLTWQYNER